MIQATKPTASEIEFTFNQTNPSIYISDEQMADQFFLYADEDTLAASDESDAETTRRGSYNSINTRPIDDEATIITKMTTSPMSEYKTLHIDTISQSCDYLHSTELPEVSQLGNPKNICLSPVQMGSLDNVDHAPLSSSHNQEVMNQIQVVDTMLQNISSFNTTGSSPTHTVIQDYEATFVDDLTVSFADNIRIIRDNNEEWIKVEIVNDGRQGFVPREVVIDIEQFVTKLQDHKNTLNFQ